MISPSQVFVPGRFPVQEHNAYADRGAPQDQFSKALERGFVPLVFGSYGVGKSSLAMHCGRAWSVDSRLVYIESVAGKSLKDIFERLLEHMGYEVTVGTKEVSDASGSGEISAGAEGGVWGFLKGVWNSKISRSWSKKVEENREVAIKSPSDSKLIDLCDAAGFLLVVDELHQASEEFRKELSAFIKAYANRNCTGFKLALLGTENDANALVLRDPGIDRVLQETPVGSITEDEARLIINPGMSKLALKIAPQLSDKVARTSVGSPFVVQYLCLEMAEAAIKERFIAFFSG